MQSESPARLAGMTPVASVTLWSYFLIGPGTLLWALSWTLLGNWQLGPIGGVAFLGVSWVVGFASGYARANQISATYARRGIYPGRLGSGVKFLILAVVIYGLVYAAGQTGMSPLFFEVLFLSIAVVPAAVASGYKQFERKHRKVILIGESANGFPLMTRTFYRVLARP